LKKQKEKQRTIPAKRISIICLWILLISSIAFGVYNNFTATDVRTYVEREIVEVRVVDTSSIESFVFNFAKVYHAWPTDSQDRAARQDRLQEFMTDDLHRLNLNMLRSETEASSLLQEFQIWNLDQIDDYTFEMRYSVHQLIRSSATVSVDEIVRERVHDYHSDEYVYVDHTVTREEVSYSEESVLSFFQTTIHMDEDGNMVIIRSPTITHGVERSNFTPQIPTSGISDIEIRAEALTFLEGFFALYPTATESTLASFVRDDALPVLNTDHEFVDIVASTFIADGDQVIAHVSVQFYDPRTFSNSFAQYELVLERGDNWMIVENLKG